jgi:hypothetical protein
MSRSFKQPWVKDSPRIMKRIHNRRYRRYIKQDVKKWRKIYSEGVYSVCCAYCMCFDDYDELTRRACMSYDWEPAYAPRNKWINPYDICDWRFRIRGVKRLPK